MNPLRRLISLATALLTLSLLFPLLAQATPSSGLNHPLSMLARTSSSVQPEDEEQQEESEEEAEAEETEAEEEAEAEEAEQAGRSSAASQRVRCTVPQLQGETLSLARTALSKAHCKLGKVTSMHGHHGLIVISQSQNHGRRLPSGSAIAVHLGSGAKTGSRHLKFR